MGGRSRKLSDPTNISCKYSPTIGVVLIVPVIIHSYLLVQYYSTEPTKWMLNVRNALGTSGTNRETGNKIVREIGTITGRRICKIIEIEPRVPHHRRNGTEGIKTMAAVVVAVEEESFALQLAMTMTIDEIVVEEAEAITREEEATERPLI
jgi:hypothetical protein